MEIRAFRTNTSTNYFRRCVPTQLRPQDYVSQIHIAIRCGLPGFSAVQLHRAVSIPSGH